MGAHPLRVLLLFLVLGFALYFNARNNPFHYDDHHSIQYNPHIRSLTRIPDFFTDPHTFSSQRSGYMFRPLLLSSYALNYALGGQSVQGYRWLNWLLHVGCAFLSYRVAQALTGEALTGLAVGAAFLLHPAHAEPINYISSRSDLLSAFFVLLAFLWALRPGAEGRTCLAYLGGLLSKSVAAVLPLLVFVRVLVEKGWRSALGAWRRWWGLGLLTFVYLGTIWANRFIASSLEKAPRAFDVQILTQTKAFVYYVWLLCMPVKLSVEHSFQVAERVWEWPVLLAAGLLLSLGFWAWRASVHVGAFALLWYIVALLPASLMPLNILVSERRAYLASFGFLLVLGWAWVRWVRSRRGVALAAGVFFCLFCAALSLERNRVWAAETSLWEDAVRRAPDMYRARLNLAIAYQDQGRPQLAFAQLEEGLRLKPDYAEAWVLLGNLRREAGQIEAAEQAYRQALEHDPRMEGVYHNLGNIYLQNRGLPEEAVEYYEQTLRRNEHFVQARNNLGQAYERLGRLREARQHYARAAADSQFWESPLDPERGGAFYNLGSAAERLGARAEALDAYQRAAALLEGDKAYEEFARKAREAALRLGGESR